MNPETNCWGITGVKSNRTPPLLGEILSLFQSKTKKIILWQERGSDCTVSWVCKYVCVCLSYLPQVRRKAKEGDACAYGPSDHLFDTKMLVKYRLLSCSSSIDPTSRVVVVVVAAAAAFVVLMSADHVVSHVVLQVQSVVGTIGA